MPEDLSFSSSSWVAFLFLDITVLLFCELASEDGAQLILYSKSCFGSVVKLPCPGMDLPGKKRAKTSPPYAVKTGLCSLGHSHQLYSALVQKYPYPSGNLGLAIPKLQIWNLAVVMLCSQGFFLNAISLVIFKLRRWRKFKSFISSSTLHLSLTYPAGSIGRRCPQLNRCKSSVTLSCSFSRCGHNQERN